MKKKVTINLSEEAISKLKEIAEKEQRSISNMIEVLIMNKEREELK